MVGMQFLIKIAISYILVLICSRLIMAPRTKSTESVANIFSAIQSQ